ncbi:MAG TPA: hypothetical protein VHY34_07345 [Caulobacteraceae bacterium]|jgi:hypothetical protein|nr:hypothetical protein [Caulobacteraceae bacterium]
MDERAAQEAAWISYPMNTKAQEQAIGVYVALIGEAKFRIQWIEYALSGRTGLDAPLVREFGYLQLRMICELVALGCLTVHGDIQETRTRRFQDDHAADRILDGLERLHHHFYPRPSVEVLTGPAGRQLDPLPPDAYLTKNELLDLYRRQCGSALHKGSLKNLLKSKPTRQTQFPELVLATQKMAALLRVHLIGLLDDRTQIICFFHNTQGVVAAIAAEVAAPPDAEHP